MDKKAVNKGNMTEFETGQTWASRQELVDWVKEIAADRGHVVVTGASSTSATDGRVPAVYLVCSRSGNYRQHGDVKKTNRPIRTIKCGCPFALRANMVGQGEWKLSVIRGYHNHEGSKYVASKDDYGKYHGMAKEILLKLADPKEKVKDFVKDLVGLPGLSETPTKNIYNARNRLKSGHNDPLVTKLKEIASPEIGGIDNEMVVDANDEDAQAESVDVEMLGHQEDADPLSRSVDKMDRQAMEVLLSMKAVKEGKEKVKNVVTGARMFGNGSRRVVARGRGRGRGWVGMMRVVDNKELGVYTEDSRCTIPYWLSFPVSLRPIITNIVDVPADGNCGYRAVAIQVGLGVDNWRKVRRDCLEEMQTHADVYKSVMQCEYALMLKAVAYMQDCPHRQWWLQLPEMGHVIASTYNCVLHTIGADQSLTFFPLRTAPSQIGARRVITLGHVNSCHFVIVQLTPDCPLPPTNVGWTKYHYPAADGWPDAYVHRMVEFTNIVGKNINTDDGSLLGRPILID